MHGDMYREWVHELEAVVAIQKKEMERLQGRNDYLKASKAELYRAYQDLQERYDKVWQSQHSWRAQQGSQLK